MGCKEHLCYLHESKQRIKGHIVSSGYSNEKFMVNLESTNLNIFLNLLAKFPIKVGTSQFQQYIQI
jgi:hypothetical protein